MSNLFSNSNLGKAAVLICGLLIVLAYAHIARSQGAGIDEDAGLKAFISKCFPDSRIWSIEDLDSDTKDYFKDHYPRSNPAVVCGDFDGNALTDYAVLLQQIDNKTKRSIFSIWLQIDRNQFHLAYKAIISSREAAYMYILPVPVGQHVVQTKSVDSPSKEITLNHTAVELVYFGKTSTTYYWDAKDHQFAAIQTSD